MMVSNRTRWLRQIRGVTLVELMIALIIVSLLALIALPSYRFSMVRAHRVEVRVLLTEFASHLSELSIRSATGQLPVDFGDAVAEWDKRNEFYHIDVAILDQGFGYWIVAYPDRKKMQQGDGAQALSHTGTGCWYKQVDKPAVNAPCDQSSDEFW